MKRYEHVIVNEINVSHWLELEIGNVCFYDERGRITKFDISSFSHYKTIKVVITEMLEDKSEIWIEEI